MGVRQLNNQNLAGICDRPHLEAETGAGTGRRCGWGPGAMEGGEAVREPGGVPAPATLQMLIQC